jgi:microcystin-dependent protein
LVIDAEPKTRFHVAQEEKETLMPTVGAVFGEIRTFAFGTNLDGLKALGWLECDGKSYSQDDYKDLFKAIGTAWGSVDPNNVFNVPDLKGVFLRGWNHGGADDPDASSRTARLPKGATADSVGSMQSDAFQSHGHRLKDYKPRNMNTVPAGGTFILASGDGDCGAGCVVEPNSGSVSAGETRPKNVYVLYCIYAGDKKP